MRSSDVPWVMPILAAVLALYLWSRPEPVNLTPGEASHGVGRVAFTCWEPSKGLERFCYTLTNERR